MTFGDYCRQSQDDPFKWTSVEVDAVVVVVVVAAAVAVVVVRIVVTKKITSFVIKTLLTTLENTQTCSYTRDKFLAARGGLITMNNAHFPKIEDRECFK